jgi:hypothetical protein
VAPGATPSARLVAPAGKTVSVEVSAGLPLTVDAGESSVRLLAPADVERASGSVRLSIRYARGQFGLEAPYEAVRWLSVTTGSPSLIRDGGFVMGDVAEWAPERTSPYAWDPGVGHGSPGSLRVSGPFDRRLVHWNIAPIPGREMRLRCWVKTERLAGCLVTLNTANFAPDRWLNGWCLASPDPAPAAPENPVTASQPGRIPSGTSEWTLVEAVLPGDAIPAETGQMAFFLDVKGGDGTVWIDDVDLWQP